VLASRGPLDWGLLAVTLAGTALAALGASGLNQYAEWRRDALMERTRGRPLPQRQLTPTQALVLSVALGAGGVLLLAWQVNLLTALLALSVQVVYIGLYTPLKTRSPLCTLVGAYCGAVPPMMGYSAATGTLEVGAYVLGALLFAWQIPHFLALAWMYRDDYARGGHKMLPVIEENGRATMLMVLLYTLALLPVSLAVVLAGLAGWLFFTGSALLGIAFAATGVRLLREQSRTAARRVFLASIAYLPLVLLLLLADRGPWLVPREHQPLQLVVVDQPVQQAVVELHELSTADVVLDV
jgi:protoheme IX farnesyltransferase